MTRRLDPDLLARLSEQRYILIRSGSFGPSYTAAVDAFRLAQSGREGRVDILSNPPKDKDNYSGTTRSPGDQAHRSYEVLE